MSAEETEEESSTPAEVIEIVGKTGMHGEAMQVKCRIREGDVLQLRETAREADSIGGQ